MIWGVFPLAWLQCLIPCTAWRLCELLSILHKVSFCLDCPELASVLEIKNPGCVCGEGGVCGREAQEEGGICMYIADSHCCIAETNTIL